MRSMANFVPLLKTSELPRGAKKTVFVAGKRIMVANVDGKFFAIDSKQVLILGRNDFLVIRKSPINEARHQERATDAKHNLSE